MRACWYALLAALIALAWAPAASAQFPGGGFGPPLPQQQPSSSSKPKKDPNQPETHAAPGSGDDTIPKTTTGEPSLPNDPLEIPDDIKKQIGSSGTVPNPAPVGPHVYTFAPFYFDEKAPGYQFKLVFPLYAERTRLSEQGKDEAGSYGLLYYRQRSPSVKADVLFPFFWNWEQAENKTTVIGPVGWHSAPGQSDRFFAPFYFEGHSKTDWYMNVPPLLTFLKTTPEGGRSIAGPLFCFWRGGSTCDMNTADSLSMGVAPLFFAGKDETSRYELFAPLLHYYSYSSITESWFNLWGPIVRAHWPTLEAFHVAPFFFRVWGEHEDHITIPPLLFHYGYTPTSSLLVTPLFATAHGDHGEETFASWLYARYRGKTRLDMVTPFFWHYENPSIYYKMNLLFPFVYQASSPTQSDLAIFPFYGSFHREGISDTTFVTPFFEYTKSITGWSFNFLPLMYLSRDREHSSNIFLPLYYDSSYPTTRTTIAFPFFWRFANETSLTQLVLNTFYYEHKLGSGTEWQVHFFPVTSFGGGPNSYFWNVLYGLVGFSRNGAASTMKLLWIPFKLSDDISH